MGALWKTPPISGSLLYSGAQSKCRYPAAKASWTALPASPSAAFQVPNPTAGIFAPVLSVKCVLDIVTGAAEPLNECAECRMVESDYDLTLQLISQDRSCSEGVAVLLARASVLYQCPTMWYRKLFRTTQARVLISTCCGMCTLQPRRVSSPPDLLAEYDTALVSSLNQE